MLLFWNKEKGRGQTREEWREWQREQEEQRQRHEKIRQAWQNFNYADPENTDKSIRALNEVSPPMRFSRAKGWFTDSVRRNNAAM